MQNQKIPAIIKELKEVSCHHNNAANHEQSFSSKKMNWSFTFTWTYVCITTYKRHQTLHNYQPYIKPTYCTGNAAIVAWSPLCKLLFQQSLSARCYTLLLENNKNVYVYNLCYMHLSSTAPVFA